MKRRFPILRTIFGAVAVVAFVLGIWSGVSAWQFGKEIDEASTARLAVLPDALGKEGTTEGEFCPKHGFFHGNGLIVEPVDAGIDWGKDVTKPMAGIEGNVFVLSGDRVEREIPLKADAFYPWHTGPEGERVLPCLSLGFVPPGDYVLRISVTKVPSALAGVPHQVVARYQMCGLERVQARVMWWLAAGFLVIGAIISLLVGVTILKNRREPEPAATKQLAENDGDQAQHSRPPEP